MDVTLPAGVRPAPVVVLLHGGFWLQGYGADLMDDLARDAAERGWASVNVEYRRVGGSGGWPMTFEDVAAAVDQLATLGEDLDLARVAVVGHSAGGHLALWAAARDQLPAGAPGANPVVRPCAVVGQAAVSRLADAATAGVGGRAVAGLMGGSPSEVPERYAWADPAALLPLDVPVLLVHGRRDDIVPPDLSTVFGDRARQSGDDVTDLPFDGGHFVVLDPQAMPWQDTMAWLQANC